MKYPLYQIDAFADAVFRGNPAAVVPLTAWLDDATLLNIAAENNLSETAFYVPAKSSYELRWFTPTQEVDLCGHATLASAYVILEYFRGSGDAVTFQTRSGTLEVTRQQDLYTLDLPAREAAPCDPPLALLEALGVRAEHAYRTGDLFMVVVKDADTVLRLRPDPARLRQVCASAIVTSRGDGEADFVSRFFAPGHGIDEDPVTGSAHCVLAPYWSRVLDRKLLTAVQLSARGGRLTCEWLGERVKISGKVAEYLVGEIRI